MSEFRPESKEQRARGKEHILFLRGEAKAILKCEIPRSARNDKIQVFSNQKGIALVMVLVLSTISLAIIAALVYMITAGTQMTGIHKRYETALEAGKGGTEVVYQLIAGRGNITSTLPGFTSVSSSACITAKLNTTTSSTNWASCTNYNNASLMAINPSDTSTYDIYFEIGTIPSYGIYSKIVHTVEGNSGGDEGLLKTGVVLVNPGEVQVVSIPYLYTVEVAAENLSLPVGKRERGQLSILYQY